MVWGGITDNDRPELLFINCNLNYKNYKILRQQVVPFLQSYPNSVFQYDNARPHIARTAITYLEEQNILRQHVA